jgi:hypothetical protein
MDPMPGDQERRLAALEAEIRRLVEQVAALRLQVEERLRVEGDTAGGEAMFDEMLTGPFPQTGPPPLILTPLEAPTVHPTVPGTEPPGAEGEGATVDAALETSRPEKPDVRPARPERTAPPPPPPPLRSRSARPVEAPWAEPTKPIPERGWGAGEPVEPAWKGVLRRIHMLPPERTGSVEAQLGTWWLTRIGALIFVIGMVFFGIYVSAYTTPWVRLAELTAVAVGVAVLGLWLERRRDAQYGAVLVGAGLALIYFAAFGASVFKPLKVIDSAAWGTAWQFAAAGLIVGAALRRNSQTLAMMATLCGYVACFFSFVEGFHDFALVSAWLLAAGAAVLNAWRGWPTPAACALPFNYVIFAWMVLFTSWRETTREFWWTMLFPLAAMALYIRVDHRSLERGELPAPRLRTLMMLFNTSAAVVLALIATGAYFESRYDACYFMFGAALLATAGMYWATSRGDALIHLFYLKGSALISLGVISHFDGRTRWVALAVQALLILLSAKRSRKKLHEALATATWLVSLLFFAADMSDLGSPGEAALSFASRAGAIAIAYVLFSTWLLSAKGRWLATEEEADPFKPISGRQSMLGVWGIAAGVAAILACVTFTRPANGPLALVFLAAAMAATAGFGRHWVAGVAAMVPFLAGHVLFRVRFRTPEIPQLLRGFASAGVEAGAYQSRLLLNGIVVIGLTLAAALLIDEWWARRRDEKSHGKLAAGAVALHALWIFALLTALFDSVPHGVYLLLAVGLGAGLAAAATRLRHRYLADLAALPLLIALADLMLGPPTGSPVRWILTRLRESAWETWLAPAAAVGAFALAALSVRWTALRERFRFLANDAQEWVLSALATAIGLAVMLALLDATGVEKYWLMTVATCAGIAVAALARRPGVRPALWAGMFYLILAEMRFVRIAGRYGRAADMGFLALALLSAVAMLGLAVAARKLRPSLDRGIRTAVEGALGAMSLLMLLVLFVVQGGKLAGYTTVFWGTSAIAIFAAGLAGRVKPLRIVSLIGLALCLGRIFLVDARSALDRIFAFVGVGIALLAVGFLYNKYRDRIQRLDQADGEAAEAALAEDKPLDAS